MLRTINGRKKKKKNVTTSGANAVSRPTATFLVRHSVGRRGQGISSRPRGAVLTDRGEKAST